jgi:galactokinase
MPEVNLDRFEDIFGKGNVPICTRVPGRVNIIGEHTDYNDGFVLPVAVNRYVHVTGRISPDRWISVYSTAFGERHRFSPEDKMNLSLSGWKRFAEGIVRTILMNADERVGMDLLVENDLPVGGGLSSSAAFAAGLGTIAAELNGVELHPFEFAGTLQNTEHEYAGVECGIMDQLSILLSRKGNALLIDCRSLRIDHIPIPSDWSLVIMDTGIRHDLDFSEYSERRRQCAEIIELYRQAGRKFSSLRDVSSSDLYLLEKVTSSTDVLLRRCRHVITENLRVIEAAQALRASDEKRIDRLFKESHRSLRDDFEVTCPELDSMVETSWIAPGCIAARMTGGGFGGCTVNFVEKNLTEEFIGTTLSGYREKTGRNGTAIKVSSIDGIMSREGKLQ